MWSLGTNYAGAVWSGGLNLNQSRVQNGGASTAPAAITRLSGAQISLGHTWSDATAEAAPSRRVSTQLLLNLQRQSFSGASGSVPSRGLGLRVDTEWTPRFKVDLSVQHDAIESTTAPDVRLAQAQLGATYAFDKRWTAYFFTRYLSRDGLYASTGVAGSVRQATTERAMGLQLQYQWQ